MNPENCSSHITDRHSHLWRKSMFIEKAVPDTQGCHKQLNECTPNYNIVASTLNTSWRSRNNMIKTNFTHLSGNVSLRRERSVVDDILKEEKMQTKGTKSMLKSLSIDKDALVRSRQLIEGMSKLKEMKLLEGKDLSKVKFPGVIRHEHIYNDYHERVTNPGYSRNHMGKFYTK